ncbi:PDZ domain-containing protein [Paenibacillus albiflavus]|uniref:endopeptidase La n=2 Tax=Paenibacillus albiflavus TaxID=2545760 RepID=A0A4R4EL36_9BACL|nr:PDZ domain-containing protein [Paenibacillus albiflavus]
MSSVRLRDQRKKRVVTSVLIGLILACILFLIPLPYYIYKPGSAEEIKPMVVLHDKSQTTEEKGTFMLTTVRAETARLATYLVALVHPYQELGLKESAYQPGESQSEYTQRQVYVMRSSQSDAIQAAYKHAQIPYHISGDGVMVLRFVEGTLAASVLQTGDIITKLDDTSISSTDELRQHLSTKKPGDSVNITYKRGNETLTSELKLSALKDTNGKETGQVGLGIMNPADLQSIRPEDESKEIEVNVGDIGGPSAGLMFSLEIYNQLVPEDITKGYRIAGTGTINPEGAVGAIGGIQHKIIAADREHAEIFFAPADYTTEQGYKYTNYSDAAARAKQIGTKMKIVPVHSMDEALQYLASLPAK